MLKTKGGELIDIDKLNWHELIRAITPVNANLATALEKLSHDQNMDAYTFYKANYQFGSPVISKNMCYLPLANGDSIAFNDKQLPDSLLADLNFNPTFEDPLGIVINKTSEFYLSIKGKLQVHSLIHRGQMFGVPRAIDNNSALDVISSSVLNLNLNAGARSLFMLAKLGDQRYHSKLRQHYAIKALTPKSLREHWEIFVELARKSGSSWRCSIIYFPRKFIDRLTTVEWSPLANCLIRTHRASYNIRHNLSAIWDNTFKDIEYEKRLAGYSLATVSIAKELLLISGNGMPGFAPATDENAAPINLIQDAYINAYELNPKRYNSVAIMHPVNFSIYHSEPIYYSINYLPFIRDNLEIARKTSSIAFLNEVSMITQTYIKAILASKHTIQSLYEVANAISITYYHSEPQEYRNILHASVIAKTDPRFIQKQFGQFPQSNQFFKGCIKIARKQ